jgi:hypothetical protein
MGNYTQVHPAVSGRVTHRHYGAGALGGLLAGLVMIVVAMVVSAGRGAGFWLPVRSIGALFFGVNALVGGAGVLAAAFAFHLAFATLLGSGFGTVVGRVRAGSAFALGISYGIAIWAAMTFGILPAIDPTMSTRVGMIPVWWFAFHLIYGGMMLFVPLFSRDTVPAVDRP